MSQQIGEFELNRPGMCKNCPHIDLNMEVSHLYYENEAIISINCSYRDICKRAYDMGVEETQRLL